MGCFVTTPKYNCNHIPVLLFFIVILQLCDNAGSVDLIQHAEKETDNPTGGTLNIVRVYKLLNHCSNKHMRIYGRNKEKKKPIDASADENDEWADLRVETFTFNSHLTIQSNISRKYLCFNKKGKLKVRHSGKRKLCVFKEIHEKDHGYTEFQSVHNPLWKLGFNKRGSPLKGDFYMKENGKLRKRHLDCLRFTKREFEPYVQPGPQKPKSYSPWETDAFMSVHLRGSQHVRHRRFPHKRLKRKDVPVAEAIYEHAREERPRVIRGRVGS